VDGISLDALLAEIRPHLLGRHVRRVRLGAARALLLEIAGERDLRLWLDAGRRTAGGYLLPRETVSEVEEREDLSGRARHALLHLRKHLEGVRLTDLTRIPGERTLVLAAAGGATSLVLRLSGPAPALTLHVEGRALATLGDGPPAQPLPPAEDREWDALDPEAFARAVAAGQDEGRALRRSILAACPTLGPHLAATLDGSAAGFAALRERLRTPRPALVLPRPLAECHGRDLVAPGAVQMLPVVVPGMPQEQAGRPGTVVDGASWIEAAATVLRLRARGRRFERRRQAAVAAIGRRAARAERLVANLERDLAGLPVADTLRRQAEALLASPPPLTVAEDGTLDVPDPRDPALHHRIAAERGLSAPALADRLFARARRMEAARRNVAARLETARAALADLEQLEAGARDARDVSDLPSHEEPARRKAARDEDETEGRPRRYLTSRGLELLVGRSARENQQLTFERARPDDIWCHALDMPGSHVIVRDGEGRATAADEREAAEVAAFFSGAQQERRVDVHVTRRKFVLPVRGAPGRVRIVHSEVQRVEPKDPAGRLRRR